VKRGGIRTSVDFGRVVWERKRSNEICENNAEDAGGRSARCATVGPPSRGVTEALGVRVVGCDFEPSAWGIYMGEHARFTQGEHTHARTSPDAVLSRVRLAWTGMTCTR
jgi:hypothetical protein